MLSKYMNLHGNLMLVEVCEICGEEVSSWYCDEDGRPVEKEFDNSDSHVCPYEEDEEDWED